MNETMIPRKYYHHVEKDPENIRPIWKVLHLTTFILIIINSLFSAYMFADILKLFNHRCVLHVEPTFGLTQVTYTNNITQEEVLDIKTEENNVTVTEEIITMRPVNEKDVTILDSGLKIVSNNTVDWSKEKNMSKNVYIINETFWHKNYSGYGKIDVHIRGSDYGSSTSCDLVIFVPLLSLIAASAFGALIILFGRGQQTQRSWIIVYPILIASAILTILSIIAMVSMANGLEDFCSHFQIYTGHPKCSRYMSYFTFQEKWTTNEFWENYTICYYSHILGLLLWIIQMLVTILRLSSLADFQFVAVSVERPEINANEEFDEKIHNALIHSGMKPIYTSLTKEKNNSTSEKNEESTTC